MADRIILDITRLYSRRYHSADTGIDRVERGVFSVLAENEDSAFLIRNGNRYFLLRGKSAIRVLNNPKKGKLAAYWQLNRAAFRRAKTGIDLKGYQAFYHLGHTRHDDNFWQNLKQNDLRIHVLIHDVIPLDFPETCRRDQLPVFKRNFSQWIHYADHIITPSQYSRDRILAHARPRGDIQVQPLYVDKISAPETERAKNAFLCIGTIEPRKNHMTLLTSWQQLHHRMGEDCPELWLIGARGWENNRVFEFLDNSPLMGKYIFELGAVDDQAMQDAFARAKAILQPSLAEGFGLPFYEAILSGQNILASDIPAFREAVVEKDQKELIHPTSVKEWVDKIEHFKSQDIELDIKLPANWSEYFKTVS